MSLTAPLQLFWCDARWALAYDKVQAGQPLPQAPQTSQKSSPTPQNILLDPLLEKCERVRHVKPRNDSGLTHITHAMDVRLEPRGVGLRMHG